MVPLLLQFVLFLCPAQDDAALGEAKSIEECDLSFRPPAEWEPIPLEPPALVKFLAPKSGPAGGQITFRYLELGEPRLMKAYFDDLIAYLGKDFPDLKITSDKEIAVSGCAGRILVAQGKDKDGREVAQIRTVVQRNLKTFYLIDAQCEARDLDRLSPFFAKVLEGVKIGLPLSDEETKLLGQLPALTINPALAGEQYGKLVLGPRKLGYQRLLIREEKLDGAAAYGFESEVSISSDDGRNLVRSTGAFTPDGTSQRCEFESAFEGKDGAKRVFRETVTIRSGEVVASRDINGTKIEDRFKVPERTFLSDAAEVVRRSLALAGPRTCAVLALEPFHGAAHIETIEVAAPEKLKLEGGERELTAVLVKVARSRNLQYFYEKDGTLFRLSSGRNPLMIQRCTREEAIKP